MVLRSTYLKVQTHILRKGIGNTDQRAKTTYDQRHGVRKLPPLQNGEPVLLKLDGEK